MQTLQQLDVNYMSGAENPWIPFTPLSDQVFCPSTGRSIRCVARSSSQ